MTIDAPSSDRMIKLPEVMSMTGLSRSSIYLLGISVHRDHRFRSIVTGHSGAS